MTSRVFFLSTWTTARSSVAQFCGIITIYNVFSLFAVVVVWTESQKSSEIESENWYHEQAPMAGDIKASPVFSFSFP